MTSVWAAEHPTPTMPFGGVKLAGGSVGGWAQLGNVRLGALLTLAVIWLLLEVVVGTLDVDELVVAPGELVVDSGTVVVELEPVTERVEPVPIVVDGPGLDEDSGVDAIDELPFVLGGVPVGYSTLTVVDPPTVDGPLTPLVSVVDTALVSLDRVSACDIDDP